MILRDLIATPEVKAALPEQMVTVLRLLLLPLGFNIRNLVVSGGMRGRVVGSTQRYAVVCGHGVVFRPQSEAPDMRSVVGLLPSRLSAFERFMP